MKESAGTLLYRMDQGQLQVLLVHPSGPYNRKAPWSIPKGGLNPGEDHEAAARRETIEETAVVPGELTAIGTVRYVKSRKTIYCFAGPAPADASPTCQAGEVDCAEFVSIKRAYELLHQDQRPFLDRLKELLSQQ